MYLVMMGDPTSGRCDHKYGKLLLPIGEKASEWSKQVDTDLSGLADLFVNIKTEGGEGRSDLPQYFYSSRWPLFSSPRMGTTRKDRPQRGSGRSVKCG